MVEFVKEYIETGKKDMDNIDPQSIKNVVDTLFDAWREGKQVFIMGNGGSASTASHFASDLHKGVLSDVQNPDSKRFKVMSLTDNVSIISALANDIHYDQVFTQQLHNLLNEGDVVIAISASGNSPNVVNGLKEAKRRNAKTIALLGFTGGAAKEHADHVVHVDSHHYGHVEDCHVMVHHLVTAYLHKKIKESE